MKKLTEIKFEELNKRKKALIKKYNIPDLDIKGCNDCERCFYTGVPCVIDDDFNEIANEIIESDEITRSLV